MREPFIKLLTLLPPAVSHEIYKMAEGQTDFEARLTEIRLRARHHASITYDGKNMLLPVRLEGEEIAATLASLCDGSVYVYDRSLSEGYLTAFGFRVGVGGRAVIEGGHITGLADPTSLCIRIPHSILGAGEMAADLFRARGGRQGFLVYAPPGGGKTTLLRDLARLLSSGGDAVRVALIDVRGELYGEDMPSTCQIDVLCGYPLGVGIEIATRTLAPEVIICDEIGSPEDAASVLSVAGAGVPLIASAHGGSAKEVLAREPIRMLAERGIFRSFLGILRTENGYRYRVDSMENAMQEGETVCSFG